MKIGIIVGRFQTSQLHDGYKYLLSNAQINYDQYAIILGSSQQPNDRNPLPFTVRKKMIEDYVYKKPLFIDEIVDVNNTELWNKKLDLLIQNHIQSIDNIYLIGSRDSFILTYNGCFKTIEIEALDKSINSTIIRQNIHFICQYDFIIGFLAAFIKHKFKRVINKSTYNVYWSRGYIYYIKSFFYN